MPRSAIEVMIFKPDLSIAANERGVHENLWIKQRYNQYLSIGVYLEGRDFKFYSFGAFDKDPEMAPQIFDSLYDLQQSLPDDLNNIFDNKPRLYLMGHGGHAYYGLSNHDDPSEIIYNDDFDRLITLFKQGCPTASTITLEACNTDDQFLASQNGHDETFLQRVSLKHPELTVCGSGPRDPKDAETGHRASGGFPILNVPITSMVGGVWKHGNTVIFYHDGHQLITKKSKFASTNSAKKLKINTINYVQETLAQSDLSGIKKAELIKKIRLSREINRIDNLAYQADFPKYNIITPTMISLKAQENRILDDDKDKYISQITRIVTKTQSGKTITERETLIVALCLKDYAESKDNSIFNGHDKLLSDILSAKELLAHVMVTCGKVLIAEPSNDSLIDFLLKNRTDINSTDKNGKTALHYAAQSFFNYREEPISLIKKLMSSGADPKIKDNQEKTPLETAVNHSKKSIVISGHKAVELLSVSRRPAWVLKDSIQAEKSSCDEPSDESVPTQKIAKL